MLKLNTSFRKIVIFGPQGSGKGTQAKVLARTLGVPWISTGDIYRKNIHLQTDLGKLVSRYTKAGKLVPDNITNQLISQRLKENDVKKGFVLDGYPRNEVQFKKLNKIAPPKVALEIWISDQEAVFRISKRRVCHCGSNYHLDFDPPRIKDACDQCGGKLVQREDDKEAAIKKRLAIYHKNTEKLFSLYLKKGILIRINGEQTIPMVTKEIFRKLNKQEFAQK